MAMNYSPQLPRDKGGEAMQEYPAPKPAVKSWGQTVTVSSVITLTDNTTTLEVGATGGGGTLIKWVQSTDTTASVIASGSTANYDHYVPSGTVRRFVVPVDTTRVAQPQSVVGVNVQSGLYSRVAWIQASSSTSVFGAEY